MVHALHDLQSCVECSALLWAAGCGAKSLEVVSGGVQCCLLLNKWEIPGVLLLKVLFGGCIEYDVRFDSVPDASSFRVLASSVDGVDDRVGEPGVADNGWIVRDPDVHESSVWVDGVVGIVGVMVEHALPWLLGGCAEPDCAVVECALP